MGGGLVARPARPIGVIAGGGASATLVVAVALLLARQPPAAVALIGGLGALAVLALVIARFDLAVGLGFLLLGVVRIEPAPVDAVLATVIGVAVATGRFDVRRVPTVIVALLAVLLGLNLASLHAAVDLGEAARFLGITLYLGVFALWLATYAGSRRGARVVVVAYVAGAVASAVLAVLALFVPYPGHELVAGPLTRAQGLFKDPNVFGPFLIPALLILLEESLRPRLLGLGPRTSAVLVLVTALGVLFSYSRAAWLNLAVAMAVIVVSHGLRRGGGRFAAGLVALALAAGGAGVAVTVGTGSTAFLRERAQPQVYDTERFGGHRLGVRLAEEHPLGIGPGQFEAAAPLAAHSTYVRVLAEQGVVGLAALVALLGTTLLLAGRNALTGRDAHGVGSAVLLGAWCGLLANSAFVDTLHWRHLWLVAALIWAASMRPLVQRRGAPGD